MSNTLINSLLPNIDSILGVRDSIGAVLHSVYFLTRTWTGKCPGDGTATDQLVKVTPTPGIRIFAHDLKLVEGGAVKQGDLLLKGLSKHQYADELLVSGYKNAKNIEFFYLVNEAIYTVINVKDDYLTWDVQLRKLSNQTRYENGE